MIGIRTTVATVALGVGLVAFGRPVVAHHAFTAEFDASKPVTLRGTVTKMEWVNPHSWIHLDVKKPDGKTEKWMIEGGTPNTLHRRGVTRDSLKIGETVTVHGFAARKPDVHLVNGRTVILADGRRVFGFSGADEPSTP